MNLQELILLKIYFPYYRNINLPTISIKPFDILLIPYLTKYILKEGDYLYTFYNFRFLIITIDQTVKTKKNKDGK